MSEFELLAQDLLEKAEAEEQLRQENDKKLLGQVLEIYDQKYVAELLRKVGKNEWSRETLNRWINGKCSPKTLTLAEEELLRKMLPEAPAHHPDYAFRFIDLFAGIGGIRKGFETIGGQCVFTSEWNKEAVRTYKANWFNDAQEHTFNLDIREVTLSDKPEVPENDAYAYINEHVPDHDVLLAGFPCQPFSLAGVSKKNSLGRAHGFECEAQGTLFFDVARIIRAKKPAIFVLENVKNLKSHDKGKTFKVIMDTLDELGYEVADAAEMGKNDPKVIDGKHFLPQHRERIVLVGFRRDLNIHQGFTLREISEVETGADVPETEVELEFAAGVTYELSPAWKLGAEAWGAFEADEHGASAGPAISWAPSSRLWTTFTVGFGFIDAAPDATFAALIGLVL